ncbi:uncharacterized protein [Aristolochia californica]|uniref:uncharacterized protein n=1 Tax=Aristolochia californica TaxID=171875 RepID=UPI0035DDE52D
MDQTRAQGLYFNCDEKYRTGHLCKRLFWLEVDEKGDLPNEEVETEVEKPAISLYAMTGLHSTNTMQVYATINNLMLLALVDSDSTHNFLSQPAAQQLGLLFQNNSGISVSMANGDKVISVGFCSAVPFVMEGNTFVADFLVIPLAGFDLVLGIKWLQQLGLILWDFQSLTMSFTQDHHQLTLHGTHAQPHCTVQTITAQHSD